jgi:hypothetical protein
MQEKLAELASGADGPVAAADGWHELAVANPTFLLERLGSECTDLQALRELTVNGLDAIAALGADRPGAGMRRGRGRVGRLPHVPPHGRVAAVRRGPQRSAGAAVARASLSQLHPRYLCPSPRRGSRGTAGAAHDKQHDKQRSGNRRKRRAAHVRRKRRLAGQTLNRRKGPQPLIRTTEPKVGSSNLSGRATSALITPGFSCWRDQRATPGNGHGQR